MQQTLNSPGQYYCYTCKTRTPSVPIGSDYVICLKGHKTRGGPIASALASAVASRTFARLTEAEVHAIIEASP